MSCQDCNNLRAALRFAFQTNNAGDLSSKNESCFPIYSEPPISGEKISHYEKLLNDQQQIICKLADDLADAKAQIKQTRSLSSSCSSPLSNLTLNTLSSPLPRRAIHLSTSPFVPDQCSSCLDKEEEINEANKEITNLRILLAQRDAEIRFLQKNTTVQ
ncbi:hypothetical protein RCL1_001685 [Eukaryota sp. TZLM3-RCL]